MKKFFLVAAIATGCNIVTAKPVDVQTAKMVASHFLGDKIGTDAVQDMRLVYTAQSTSGVANYYIFNAGNRGFVTVTADDCVKPVIAYSTEGGFDPNNIPTNATGLLDNYKEQISYAVEHNVPATGIITAQWSSLISSKPVAQRTTATVTVGPLLTTTWNQLPYYNAMCPVDASTSEQAVAGCVATATAQVMKYWNYPATGQGTHSYSTTYGILNADFGATTYDWAAMPNAVSANNNAVATLIYQIGVAVNMNYSATSSGAYVTKAQSPVTNCAEYALTTYFKYASTTHGIERSNFTDQQWIDALKTELDNMRPVIYAGFGSVGGHCWVADGYDANNMFHINWGWGGVSDGYFEVDAMNPSALGAGGGSGGFNAGQHAIIGIQPDNMATADNYENNNVYKAAYQLNKDVNMGNMEIITTGSNLNVSNDIDYYSIYLPAGDNYIVKARLQDKNSSTDGNTYTVNAQLATSRNPRIVWSPYNDSVLADQTVDGGGMVYFRVAPVVLGDMGTYVLDIHVERQTTGVNEVNTEASAISVYPNPASNEINIGLDNKKADISLVDMQGRTVQHITAENQSTAKLQVGSLANGLYLVHITSGDVTITRKVSVAH